MPTKATGRPRGRPPGAKNIPKVEAFVASSLADTAGPQRPEKPAKVYRGRWANTTPEQRSAMGRAMLAKRDPATRGLSGRKKGVPVAYTAAEWEAHVAAQKPLIAKVLKKMADNGQLPDDPRAEEALTETMLVLRSQVPPKEKIAAARLILDFTKAKPSQKIEHTVRSAEDLLDEMAAEDDPE